MSYPEHEKQKRIQEKSQACGEFLAWLRDVKGFPFVEYHKHSDACCYPTGSKELCCGFTEDSLVAVHTPMVELLAEFFSIDLKKIEEEKRRMVAELRGARSGKWVAVHEDCDSRLDAVGYCAKCEFIPDMQSTRLEMICEACDQPVAQDHRCSKCGRLCVAPG